jgi:hypothetical protein
MELLELAGSDVPAEWELRYSLKCTYEAIGIVIALRAFQPHGSSWRSLSRRLEGWRCGRTVDRRSRHDGLLRRRCLNRVVGLGSRRSAGAHFLFHLAFASRGRHMPWTVAEGHGNRSNQASARTASDHTLSYGGAIMKTTRGCSRRTTPKEQRKPKELARCLNLQCVPAVDQVRGDKAEHTLPPDIPSDAWFGWLRTRLEAEFQPASASLWPSEWAINLQPPPEGAG